MDAEAFAETPQAKDPISEFCAFWDLYPRRVAKKDAEKAWRGLSESQRFAAIQSLPIHVHYWDAIGTTKDWLPYPASWLRGERWTDELEMPKEKQPDWWASDSGIMREGLKRGIRPRPGESMQDFKARVAMQRMA